MAINPQLIQLAINALPTVINAGLGAAQNLNQSYQQQMQSYLQGKKQFENLVFQDIQKKKEADRKLFETIKQSNQDGDKYKNQESLGSAWAQALGMDSLSGNEE